MTDAAAIIDRLRAATGPDRELDAEINCAVSPYALSVGRNSLGGLEIRQAGMRWGIQHVPHYTASLDAALTLFDERPDEISTDPIKACIAALLARQAAEAASDE